MTRACETCRYSDGDDPTWRTCRRNPPTVNPDGPAVAQWPLVRPDDWCGEFRRTVDQAAHARAWGEGIVSVVDVAGGRPTVLPPLGPMPERDSW